MTYQAIRFLLFGIALCIVGSPNNATAAASKTVFVVRAADTNGSLKNGVIASLASLDGMIARMKNAAGLSVQVIDIKGDDFSCSQISAKVKGLPATENDVVLFYYLGHGFRSDSTSVYPEFDCVHFTVASGAVADSNGSSASLDSVVALIQNLTHKPRLVIAVADACNRFLNTNGISLSAAATAAGPTPYANGLNHLFLDYTGLIIMASAVPGENAIYYTSGDPSILGGLFTTQLLESITSEIDSSGGTASWSRIASMATTPIELPPLAPTTSTCTGAGSTSSVVYKCQHPLASYQIQVTFPSWPH